MKLDVLVFSKDRPLQLEGYIKSLQYYTNNDVNITVLAKTTPDYREAYSILQSNHRDVKFVEESNFARQVKNWIDEAGPMIMFGCDDVIFKDHINLDVARKLLATLDPPIDFVSLRLDSNITYCQPSDKEMIVPKLAPVLEGQAYIFEWRACPMNWDWGYPFEVAGSIYRRETIKNLIAPFPDNVIGHPNKIEGPLCFQARNNWRGVGSCFAKAKMNTVTVNRVQELEKNKLCVDVEVTPKELLNMFLIGKSIDFKAYTKQYRSICIGDLILC